MNGTLVSPASKLPVEHGIVTLGLVLRTLGSIIAFSVVRFCYKLYFVRMNTRKLTTEYGIPILPHSFLWGHLLVVKQLMDEHPPGVSPMYIPLILARKYPEIAKFGCVYMDNWPFAPPMMAVFNPDLMAQFTQDAARPKHEMMYREFRPFTGLNDLVTQEGQIWKMWRSIFNPGFSSKNVLSFVPAIIEEIRDFKVWLHAVAKSGRTAEFEQPTMKLTIDIIGRVALNTRLRIQTADSSLFTAFRSALGWLLTDSSPPNIIKEYNPMRLPMVWWHNRTIRNYLVPFIKQAMTERETSEGPKTIVKLAANAYVEESGSSKSTVDAQFIDMAVSQLKMFIFAGHDTTAMTLCYIYHLLFTNPRCLAAVRAELDEVLGKDLGQAETVIGESPHLLNALPYTQAVIKETLRMYAPVGGVRQGGKDFFLTHPETGQKYPTEGWMLFANSMASHRLEENCPEPDIFKPERWLKNEAPIKKNAFRPFELGARNCIGQELAQVELRAILALTIREFDLESAYDPDGPKVLGEVAYQRMVPGDLTAKPIGGMPMRVRTRA